MSSFFYNNKLFLQFIFWIIPLAFLPGECLAELNDLINYKGQQESEQLTRFALNESGDEKKECTNDSEESACADNSCCPLFLGLCCGKCGGNMPLNIPGAGTPEPHELRVKFNLSWGKMVGLRRGTSNRSTSDAHGQYMMAPRKMDMHMSNVLVIIIVSPTPCEYMLDLLPSLLFISISLLTYIPIMPAKKRSEKAYPTETLLICISIFLGAIIY